MQEFLADLHIHSRFSRATSKKLDIPLLAAWARLKGLAVLGTGDFTHPAWREELHRHLRFDERSGLYVLKDPAAAIGSLPELPVASPGGALLRPGAEKAAEDASGIAVPSTHFILQGEISSIYKRGGKVRKVHNLVFMPDLACADRFSRRLAELGNVAADGRPILGLDSRDLLEMVLEIDPRAFLVPAHIWTPWFSVFGSKSGFDRLEDCFGDLSTEIFALETGLSSDPAMNRLWSALDGYRLISNSDAHSGENLGREANVFSGEISYAGMLNSLKAPQEERGTRFLGTLEFFPEEGKYHMDGHRKCGVLLSPAETRELGGICPVCGGPLTVGVLSRVMELADRDTPEYGRAADGSPAADSGLGEGSFASLVPLPEILGEILGVGPKTRRVGDMYARLLERFGPELSILRSVPESEIARFFPPLGEALSRMRRGKVRVSGGFDGEYGTVRIFSEEEQREIAGGAAFPGKKGRPQARGLALPGTVLRERAAAGGKAGARRAPAAAPGNGASRAVRMPAPDDDDASDEDGEVVFSDPDKGLSPENGFATGLSVLPGLNSQQERAVRAGPGPVLVLAGPGTGKTRTLVARAAFLLEQGFSPRRILAVTFTRRAASEMDARLSETLDGKSALPRSDTLHALALEAWHKTHADVPLLLSEDSARRVFDEANAEESAQIRRKAWQAVNLARERLETPPPEFSLMAQRYSAQKSAWNLADYTDLLEFWLEQISGGLYRPQWEHVLVDEVQDLSPLQLHLIRSFFSSSGAGFFGIGDPDQSIYSFRGTHGQCRDFFAASWPGLEIIHLDRNYRSFGEILRLSHAVLGGQASGAALVPMRGGKAEIALFTAPSAEAEAVWLADRVAALIGLGSHTLADAMAKKGGGSGKAGLQADHSPGDIAVLVRTHALAGVYRKALSGKGAPVSEPATDAFWKDERVALILHEAGRMLGISVAEAPSERPDFPPCPDKIMIKGPLGVAAYLSAFPPFDALFWNSPPFRSLVKAYDENRDWAGLITWINLRNELELVRAKGEKVQIISMHAAKGLEFRSVFLPALEDGLMPFAGTGMLTGRQVEKMSPEHLLEEQRLLYVGLSRARERLFLSSAARRTLYGRELRLQPSRFLALAPEALLSRSALVAKTTRKEKQLRLF